MYQTESKHYFINQFLRSFNISLQDGNYSMIEKHFVSLLNYHVTVNPTYKPEENKDMLLEPFILMRTDAPFGRFMQAHLKARFAIMKKDYLATFENLSESVSELLRIPELERKHLGILVVLLKEIRVLALKLEYDTSLEFQEKYVQLVTRTASFCCNDNRNLDISRKWGTYTFINMLLSYYIKKRQFNLIKSVINLKTNSNMDIQLFPKSQMLSHFYYLGVISFFDAKYTEALKHFKGALEICPYGDTLIQELILEYFLPLQLNINILPSESLITCFPKFKYHYSLLVESIVTSQFNLFDRAVEENKSYYLSKDLTFIIDKVHFIILLQLIKKVYIINDKSARISLNDIYKAYQLTTSTKHIDKQEVEFKIANLIHKDYIKGYLAHEQQMLVLSKVAPFPEITSIKEDF